MIKTRSTIIIVITFLTVFMLWKFRRPGSSLSHSRFTQSKDLIIPTSHDIHVESSPHDHLISKQTKSVEDALARVNPDLKQNQIEALLDITMMLEENPIDGREYICAYPNTKSDRFCFPRHFLPSTEWNNVLWGQDIPVGLEIQLDLSSLIRRARTIPSAGAKVSHKVDPTLNIKHLSDLDKNLVLLLENYADHPFSPTLWLQYLQKIKESVHEYRYGKILASDKDIVSRRPLSIDVPSTSLALIMHLLEHPAIEVRKNAAITIGNAAENNQGVHEEFSKRFSKDAIGLHPVNLLIAKMMSDDEEVKPEYIFALAQLNRGNHDVAAMMFSELPYNTNHKFKIPLDVFLDGYKTSVNPRVKSKLVQLVDDLFRDVAEHPMTHMLKEGERFWWTKERLEVSGRWCTILRAVEAEAGAKLKQGKSSEYDYSLSESSTSALDSMKVISERDGVSLCEGSK